MSLSIAKKTRSVSKTSEVEQRIRIQNIRLVAEINSAVEQCDPELQVEVSEMFHIVTDPSATEDEKTSACNVIADILFPCMATDWKEHHEEWLKSEEAVQIADEMDHEQASFRDAVSRIMDLQGIGQDELARRLGVGQPAISNMLTRDCRPQRKTVERFAAALGVSSDELWKKA